MGKVPLNVPGQVSTVDFTFKVTALEGEILLEFSEEDGGVQFVVPPDVARRISETILEAAEMAEEMERGRALAGSPSLN